MNNEKRAWWKEAVVYQIYPRSFADSDGDGIGDLNGITEHLDYLKELGVDVLWLSPIYASPNDDNGYDISDYRAIMKDFGTMEDFDRMLAGIHERGMKLVMDLVVNHSSDEHAWFVESRKSRDNPYRDYYIWRDGRDGAEPNNWGSCFSGPAWEKDEATGQYYLHLFSKKQPDLNWANPKVRDEVFSLMTWWCDKGIDGFRMDVINMIGKENLNDGEKRDGALYGDFGPSCCHTETTHRYLREMRERVLSKYDLLTVGETGGTPEQACRYAREDGSELNMVFCFEHTDLGMQAPFGKWNDHRVTMPELRAVLNRWQLALQGVAWNSLHLSNHDQPRAVSRFGDDRPLWRVKSAKLLATMLHMLRGTPYIYQGDELGMINPYYTRLEQYEDIEVRNAWKQWVDGGMIEPQDMLRYLARVSRDNARAPMLWKNAPHGGFTAGTPWIETAKNWSEINAEDALRDPDSVFHYMKKLIALRHSHDIIVYGSFEPLLEEDPQIYAFRRRLDGQVLTVLCNFTDRKVSCPLADTPGEKLIGSYPDRTPGMLQPYEALVILGADA